MKRQGQARAGVCAFTSHSNFSYLLHPSYVSMSTVMRTGLLCVGAYSDTLMDNSPS